MITTTPAAAIPSQLHITPTEFTEGIRAFHRTWIELEKAGGSGWRYIRVVEDSYGPPLLRITRLLDQPLSADSDDAAVAGHVDAFPGEIASEITADEEDDEAALLRSPPNNSGKQTTVVHDIVYSPSYHVPVLYISLLPGTGTDIHDLLVPTSHKAPLQHAGGPLGALSLTDHPVTGMPAYFVHPCRTGEGMAAITMSSVDGGQVNSVEYLMRWLGLVGPSVGLFVPVALAEALGTRSAVL
ncbi:hypothetical protein LTR17_021486 [Elasticomyces elasticus]|nr:hypothetical protein LTR17_021486 [Elasticomyces elasticus]